MLGSKKEKGKILKRSILIGIINQKQNEVKIKEFLDELAFLAETAGSTPVKRFTQQLSRPDSGTFIGKGKVDEVKLFVDANKIDLVIFDDEISPSQQRNLEILLERKVLDRTGLILEIFAQRAKTSYAKTQVELAQHEYLYPRLMGMWTHLERQRGGTGTRGGAGEKEIETDRRIVRKKIHLLKEKLVEIDRQMATQRRNRGDMIRVALVGYTNVGKSTLMNLLAKSDVFAENKLFATLDTTVRKVVIDRVPFLLSDTVGFIRKLPHQLVDSFKSTLDELREADILIHVVDISHPGFEEQMKEVKKTLLEIGVGDKYIITVFNKIDAVRSGEHEIHRILKSETETLRGDETTDDVEELKPISLEDLKKSWIAKLFDPCVFISAVTKENMNELKQLLFSTVKELHTERYPHQLPF
ncbi:MAG: GTPase HflX [Bacteroidetes bacterium]|nr:GTPase HflX [Bacteroidota bacterium]